MTLRMPIHLERRFDLVLCLEVAEHLPADSAPTLIDSLVSLGPVIVFSAAIPYQGGTHHVNEQRPEYWARHFATKEYVPVDFLRRQIWQLHDVEWFYAQNILRISNEDSNPAPCAVVLNKAPGKEPRRLTVCGEAE